MLAINGQWLKQIPKLTFTLSLTPPSLPGDQVQTIDAIQTKRQHPKNSDLQGFNSLGKKVDMLVITIGLHAMLNVDNTTL